MQISIFATVKKLSAFILFFYVLFSEVAPCSVFDDCKEETEQTADTRRERQCGTNCPPFSACSVAQGFADNSITLTLEPIVINNSPSYNDFYFSSKSEYYSTLFQPPRSC